MQLAAMEVIHLLVLLLLQKEVLAVLLGSPHPTGQIGVSGSFTSPLGGGFVYENSGGADPLDANSWSLYYGGNMQYTADFGAGVPEPATWAMMMVGVFGLGASLRRRREQTAVATVA